MLFTSAGALGQTPFDAFAPETSRIILDADSIAAWREAQKRDAILCAIVADLHNEQLLLVDVRNRSVLAHAPMPEDTKNWLSVDPLSDKYPNTSGYMYCNGNPVMLVDPDGRYFNDEMEGFVAKFDQQLAAKAEEYTTLRDSYEQGCDLYNHYEGLLQEVNKSRQDLIDMRDDEYYEYRFVKSSENATSCTSLNGAGVPIILMEFFEDGMQSHEGRHGGQNARREIRFRPNGTCLLYGISSEQDAYKAQLAYFGSITLPCIRYDLGDPIPLPTTIRSLSEVTRQFVSSITNGGFECVYPPRYIDMFIWLTH